VFISLAISHFLCPCRASPATVSASLMCILSYAYLLQVCVLSNFCSNPLLSRRGYVKPVHSGSLTAPPRHALYLHSRFHRLSNSRRTLPLLLDHTLFRPSATLLHPPLRKCVVYRSPSVCLSMAHLLRPNPTFAHLTYNFILPFVFWCYTNKS